MQNSRLPLVLLGLFLASNAMGYNLIGWDWGYQSTPIDEPFEINTSAFPASVGNSTEIHDAYASALGRWTNEGGAPTFSYIDGGTTNSSSWGSDGRNIGQYNASTGGSTLALAQSWGWGSEMTDCDIRFYGSNGFGTIDWSADPAGPNWNEMDFEITAAHELGHCVGLGHSGVNGAIMYPSSTSGTSVADRHLSSDDQLGLQAIYGAPADATLVLSGVSYTEIGDGDGLLEPGEPAALNISVDNTSGVAALNAFAIASTSEPHLTVDVDAALPVTDPDQGAYSVDDYDGALLTIGNGCGINGDLMVDVELFADNYTAAGVAQVAVPVFCHPTAPLVLSLSSGWTAGQPINIHVSGALPYEQVYVVHSTNGVAGNICPAAFGGECFDLSAPAKLSTTLQADASGEADWNPSLPASVPAGVAFYVQTGVARGVGGNQSVISNWDTQTTQ
ncbi:MAG: matrixin family metalloprotease [Rhodobacterales bacterium]|nr:matrixin family metalloprotease [Rhodobacterales bacterium]